MSKSAWIVRAKRLQQDRNITGSEKVCVEGRDGRAIYFVSFYCNLALLAIRIRLEYIMYHALAAHYN